MEPALFKALGGEWSARQSQPLLLGTYVLVGERANRETALEAM